MIAECESEFFREKSPFWLLFGLTKSDILYRVFSISINKTGIQYEIN